MKQIILVILFSTMLFSASRQIILGSYVEETNAIEGVQKLEEHIEDSDKLSWLKKQNIIAAKYKKIGKYFVVYLTPLDNRHQLFNAYTALERYYDDAYAIDYLPNGGMVSTEPMIKKIISKKVEVNQEEEMVVIEENVLEPEKILEPEKKAEVIENEDEYASDEDMLKIKKEIQIIDEELANAEESQEATMIIEEDTQVIEEIEIPKEKENIEPVKVVKTKKVQTKELLKEKNYYLEILLVLLVLLGVGYIIYKNKRKKGEEIQEIQLEEK